jgi:peptide chain release factor 1
VLPELPPEGPFQLRQEDLKIDVYRAGGAGGQHVNRTESAVRITHIPTGVVVAIQDDRSQHLNKAKALKILQARVYALELQQKQNERAAQRKSQIGTGDRSEKIRTYNFSQDRITDHRCGITHHDIQAMLNGELLDIIHEELMKRDREIALQNLLDEN